MNKAIMYFRFLISVGLLFFAAKLNAQEIYTMPKNAQSRASGFENMNGIRGKGGKANHGAKGHASESLKTNESKVLLDINSSGIIQRIWCTIDDRTPAMLRSLRLRIYWDGNQKPAVDVPFGDFFCAGLGRPIAFQSALFSNPEGKSFNCYIPMPFRKGAKIILTNEGKTDLKYLFFDIAFTVLPKAPAEMLYFHACWNRLVKGKLGKDFELLPRVQGKGRFLGINVGVNVDSSYGNTWWGEGEVKLYLDGDSTYPTINGTGAEDYIGTGWGEGQFTNQYQGCTIADGKNRKYAFYRFHIPDPIYFYSDFRATIQEMGGGYDYELKALKTKGVAIIPVSVDGDHERIKLLENPQSLKDSDFPKGWVNFYREDDYSATAYFYLDRPVSNLKELAPVDQRIK